MVHDGEDFELNLPESEDVVADFVIGHGVQQPPARERPNAATATRLPFGMEATLQPKKRSRKPDTDKDADADPRSRGKSSGSAPASSSSARQGGMAVEHLSEIDPSPLVLSAGAQAEWDNALVEISAVDPVAEAPRGSASADPSQEPAQQPAANASRARYHEKLGLQDLATVKRAGVVCYHCGMIVPKGELRFSMCYKTSKPARAIHTECLLQMPENCIENSIEFLRAKLQASRSMPADERAICERAMETLTASTAASSR